MTHARILTQRDIEILLALVQKVRIFSLRQIARHWWHGEMANARRRLNLLAGADGFAVWHCQPVCAFR